MSQISQYFNVKISSPKTSKKQVSFDATDYIVDGCSLVDEDGLIKEFNFDLKNGYLMMDVLSIGMRIDLVGGDLDKNQHLFSGFIKEINPKFEETGQVILRIKSYSDEGSKLGVSIRDLVYPSKNHPKSWATKELMYSDIISNLAKEVGIRVNSSNIKVRKDIKASFSKGTVRQKNMTDWAFMQMLAEKIHCTLWTTESKGVSELHLIDDSLVVGTLAPYTFYFVNSDEIAEPIIDSPEIVQKRQDEVNYRSAVSRSDKEIQIITADVKLDTQNNTGAFKQTTDPKTGETKVTTERPILNDKGEDTGETERWVLDEAKVRALSFEARQELIELFVSGKITWEGENGTVSAKQYFKKEIIGGSSRDGEANNTEVEVSKGDIKDDGVGTTGSSTENTGSKSYRTVIDEGKLRGLSSEKRSAIMGRIVRGEMTEEDKQYYKVVDTTPKEDKDDAKSKNTGLNQNTQSDVDKKKKKTESNNDKRKRDDGFSITCKVYGNLNIVPRKSYILEGLGKYSGKYYLYKITHTWGNDGYVMTLIFTK